MLNNLNYKLLKMHKRIHEIMKFQGIFLHRTVKLKNVKVNVETENEDTKNECSLEDYIKKNDIIERTSMNKFHLIYCILCTIIKIMAFPVNGFIEIYYKSFGSMLFDPSNDFKNITTTGPVYTESLFSQTLLEAANGILYTYYCVIPILVLVTSCSKSGYFKSVLSFEYLEMRLNRHSQNIEKVPLSIKKFKFIYLMIVLTLVVSYLIFFFLIFQLFLKNNFKSEVLLTKIRFFAYCSGSCICLLDSFSSLYFFSSNILIVRESAVYFYQYLSANVDHKSKIKIDIEAMRELYSDLHSHVKIVDKWIRYFNGINYITTIPNTCLLFYAVLLGKTRLYVLIALIPQLLTALLVIFWITLISVLLNMEVCIQK